MKIKILYVVLASIFIIIFNILFFILLGKTIDLADMISYGFITLSYILLVVSIYKAKSEKKENVSLGLSICTISVVYFLLELILGVSFLIRSNSALISMVVKYITNFAKGQNIIFGIFIGIIEKAEVIGELQLVASKFPSPTVAFIAQFLLLLVYLLIQIPNIIVNDNTRKNEAKRKKEISFIKESKNLVSMLIDSTSDEKCVKELEKLYDELNASPIKSLTETSELESEIRSQLKQLENIVFGDNKNSPNEMIKSIIKNIKVRNRKLKTLL